VRDKNKENIMANFAVSSSRSPNDYDILFRTGVVLTTAAAVATVIAMAVFIARSNSLAVPAYSPSSIHAGTAVKPFIPGIYGPKVAFIVCGSVTLALGTATLLYGLFRPKHTISASY